MQLGVRIVMRGGGGVEGVGGGGEGDVVPPPAIYCENVRSCSISFFLLIFLSLCLSSCRLFFSFL